MCDALPAARAVDTQRVEHHHAARQDRRAIKVPHGKGGIGHDVLPAAGHHELIPLHHLPEFLTGDGMLDGAIEIGVQRDVQLVHLPGQPVHMLKVGLRRSAKRQHARTALWKTFLPLRSLTPFLSCSPVKTTSMDATSVSYTHLDVYKRQV